jgi:hypothetical protein
MGGRQLIGVALLALAALEARADTERWEPIVLIVAAAWSGADAIDLPSLRRIYLDRQTNVGGERVRALHRTSGSPIRAGFSRSALGHSEAHLERYWIEQALLGGGLPPREVASADSLLRHVRAQPGTIGYLARSELAGLDLAGVRVLGLQTEDGVLRAGDPEYPLRFRAPAPPEPRGAAP